VEKGFKMFVYRIRSVGVQTERDNNDGYIRAGSSDSERGSGSRCARSTRRYRQSSAAAGGDHGTQEQRDVGGRHVRDRRLV